MDEKSIRQHNLNILLSARKGDLLEFPRKLGYSHWGVCLGGSKVIHLAGEPGDNLSTEDVVVRIDDFWTVAGNSLTKINNIYDGTERVLPVKEIVERANSKEGCQGYNMWFTNCEHFVTWCRYGKARSSQVEMVNSTFDAAGSKLKKILVDAVENHPDEAKRASASRLLALGKIISTVKDQYINANKSEQLKGLSSSKDGPSSF